LKYLEPHKIVLIGASTGGPGHIKKILSSLTKSAKSTIVVAQHMGEEFIPSFIQQLNSSCLIKVEEVSNNKLLSASKVYVCTGKTSIESGSKGLYFKQVKIKLNHYNPDINCLFTSGAKITSKVQVLGIILTGIGNDGAIGCKLLSEKGGECVAESESTAIVNGMPLQAKKINQDIQILSINKIISLINTWSE